MFSTLKISWDVSLCSYSIFIIIHHLYHIHWKHIRQKMTDVVSTFFFISYRNCIISLAQRTFFAWKYYFLHMHMKSFSKLFWFAYKHCWFHQVLLCAGRKNDILIMCTIFLQNLWMNLFLVQMGLCHTYNFTVILFSFLVIIFYLLFWWGKLVPLSIFLFLW